MRRYLVYLAVAFLVYCVPCSAQDATISGFTEGESQKIRSFAEKNFPLREKHPLLYKVGTPIRWSWHGCIWLGEKSKPVQPFLNTASSLAQLADPWAFWFGRR